MSTPRATGKELLQHLLRDGTGLCLTNADAVSLLHRNRWSHAPAPPPTVVTGTLNLTTKACMQRCQERRAWQWATQTVCAARFATKRCRSGEARHAPPPPPLHAQNLSSVWCLLRCAAVAARRDDAATVTATATALHREAERKARLAGLRNLLRALVVHVCMFAHAEVRAKGVARAALHVDAWPLAREVLATQGLDACEMAACVSALQLFDSYDHLEAVLTALEAEARTCPWSPDPERGPPLASRGHLGREAMLLVLACVSVGSKFHNDEEKYTPKTKRNSDPAEVRQVNLGVLRTVCESLVPWTAAQLDARACTEWELRVLFNKPPRALHAPTARDPDELYPVADAMEMHYDFGHRMHKALRGDDARQPNLVRTEADVRRLHEAWHKVYDREMRLKNLRTKGVARPLRSFYTPYAEPAGPEADLGTHTDTHPLLGKRLEACAAVGTALGLDGVVGLASTHPMTYLSDAMADLCDGLDPAYLRQVAPGAAGAAAGVASQLADAFAVCLLLYAAGDTRHADAKLTAKIACAHALVDGDAVEREASASSPSSVVPRCGLRVAARVREVAALRSCSRALVVCLRAAQPRKTTPLLLADWNVLSSTKAVGLHVPWADLHARLAGVAW
jgi:hypothetical protein